MSSPKDTVCDAPPNTVVVEPATPGKIDPRPPPDELAPGDVAGGYVIRGTISAGGCGRVYTAEHRILGRQVAVKVLHRALAGSTQGEQRFVQEARAVNLIRHPGIVDIHEFGQLADGRPFYVMEFLDGIDLETMVRQRGAMSPAAALELLEPVCAALQAAHDAGVVHRDVKASNVMVSRTGPPWQVKLLDFGIAKLIHPEPGQGGITTAGQRIGTPHYMAPEQIRAEPVDARTDVYALGVLLYRMLTAKYPFHSKNLLEIERMHLETPPPAPSSEAPVPAVIDAVVLRCLAKIPSRRFASVAEFRLALRQAIERRATQPPVDDPGQLALGVYAEVQISDEAQADMDDALMADMSQVLDLIEGTLRGAGMALALQTGSSVLGAAIVPDTDADRAAVIRRAVAVATELFAALSSRPDADPRLRINVCTHIDQVTVRPLPSGEQSFGGPLLQVGSWAPQHKMPSACLTAETAEELPDLGTTVRMGRYVLLEGAPAEYAATRSSAHKPT